MKFYNVLISSLLCFVPAMDVIAHDCAQFHDADRQRSRGRSTAASESCQKNATDAPPELLDPSASDIASLLHCAVAQYQNFLNGAIQDLVDATCTRYDASTKLYLSDLLKEISKFTGSVVTLYTASSVLDATLRDWSRYLVYFAVKNDYVIGRNLGNTTDQESILTDYIYSTDALFSQSKLLSERYFSNLGDGQGITSLRATRKELKERFIPKETADQTETSNEVLLKYFWPTIPGPVVKLIPKNDPTSPVVYITEEGMRSDYPFIHPVSADGMKIYISNLVSPVKVLFRDSTNNAEISLKLQPGSKIHVQPEGVQIGDSADNLLYFPMAINFFSQSNTTYTALTSDGDEVTVLFANATIKSFRGTLGYEATPLENQQSSLTFNGITYYTNDPYIIQSPVLDKVDPSAYNATKIDFSDPLDSLMAVVAFYTGRPVTIERATVEFSKFADEATRLIEALDDAVTEFNNKINPPDGTK